MALLNVTERLASMLGKINNSIGGTLYAFDSIPRVLHPSNLPCAIIFPSGATYSYASEGIVEETATYRIRVYLNVGWAGASEQGQDMVEPIRDNVRAYFWARSGLEDGTPQTVVAKATLESDSGFSIFQYPIGGEDGVADFSGIEFVVSVVKSHKISRTGVYAP
jgi:hypothetical protein